MSTDFTPVTLHHLRRSGWAPDRRVDIAPWVTALEAEGYEVSVAARAFLEQFGGLVLLFPHHRVEGQDDDLRVDPFEATQGIWPERVAAYGERVGDTLCLVGEAYRRNMALLIGSDGRLYAGADELLLLLGASVPDALEGLCHGTPPAEVPETGG